MALSARLNKLDAFPALSYCWEENRPEHTHRTDTTNVKQRMRQIHYHQLPKTLQEAFTIARRLGVRHFWTDAVFIVQDSDFDWLGESAKMDHTCEAAAFTIATDCGHDNEAGCLMKRVSHKT